jgi:hypothetical protein
MEPHGGLAVAAGLAARLREILAWAPDWAVNLGGMTLAVALALVLHAVLVGIARRDLDSRRVFLKSLLSQSRGPTRLALIILALGIALSAARLDPDAMATARHTLLIAFIVLVGWIATIAVRLGGQIYLLRFRLDVDDNLLARKHLTQVRILERAAAILIVVITAACALTTFESVR